MGTFADSFKHIKDRQTFYATLDKAIAASAAREDDPGFARVLAQLNAIKEWTAGDAKPSQSDIDSLDITRVIATEYEPLRATVPEVDDWAQMAGEVSVYVSQWLDDDAFKKADEDELDWS